MLWERKIEVDEPSGLAESLVLAEHATLHEEVLRSYAFAQNIVNWTLASFGVVFTAGVLIFQEVGSEDTAMGPRLLELALLLYGFGLPGILWAGAWTWLGELARAERAGAYLRGLEADLARTPNSRVLGFEPLRWERFIHTQRHTKSVFRKQIAPYLGTAALFFGASMISLIAFGITWTFTFIADDGTLRNSWASLWIIFAIALEAAFIAGAFVINHRISGLGKASALIPATFP